MEHEMLKEFIGKECVISLINFPNAAKGTVLSVDGNWVKIDEKKRTRLFNTTFIRDVYMNKDTNNLMK